MTASEGTSASKEFEAAPGESETQDEVGAVDERIALLYWFLAGLGVSLGVSAVAGGVPGGAVLLLAGIVGSGALVARHSPRSYGFIFGFAAGLNAVMVFLLIRPPCRSLGDLRLVRKAGVVNVVCTEFDDMRLVAASVFAGTIAVMVLLLFLRRLQRSTRGDGPAVQEKLS